MKKQFYLIFILFLLICCGPKLDIVERYMEDGVEVVINYLEPYKIDNTSSFTLEEIFKIDTEQKEILDLGIPDIFGFDVNSQEEIFILRQNIGEGDFIFKFDVNGEFIKSFGPKGQGPGEFQNPHHIAIDSEDNIMILDLGRYPLLKYDQDGVFIDGYEMPRGDMKITPGPRASSLVLSNSTEPETGKQLFSLKLLNPELEVLQILDGYSFEFSRQEFRAMEPIFCWSASHDNIFVANEDRGYEIWVYDFNGKLIRKVRKDYTKIPISEDYKKKILNPLPLPMRNIAYFPEFYPSFQSIVVGEDGMLLVSTFEESSNPGEFMCDIFNEEGAFISRKSLNIWIWEGHLWARIKGNKFYCLREKENGFKELVVYKMKWE